MGRILLLCGRDAKTPYRFVNPDVLVYSVEELCYVLKENAFLLDSDYMDRRLADWIASECGLRDLADLLYPLAGKKDAVGAYVLAILEYVGCFDRETLAGVEAMLRQSANLSVYEKMKSRVDYMAGSGKYAEAVSEYDVLLSRLPDAENELRARALHNKGVALSRLFLFEQAAECFGQSYGMLPLEETFVEYLAASRMRLGESEYLSFVAEQEDGYGPSLELEKQMEGLARLWEDSLYKKRLEQMRDWKTDGETMKYYEEIERIIQALKHAYRAQAGE